MSKRLSKFAAATAIYIAFAIYLYQPYFKHFDVWQYLLVVNTCWASLGCLVLSRRWVAAFSWSCLAGAVYGFGPLLLGFARFHPIAGFLAGSIPWLFCPVAFIAKRKGRWLTVPLWALPFLAIFVFFQVFTHFRLFVIPIQSKLNLADLGGLFAPLVMALQGRTLIGFYHVPVAALMMGALMLLAARRFGIMVVFAIGTIFAFCDSFLNISPIIWLALPALCGAILAGVGMQGLAGASFADRRWVLVAAVIMTVLSTLALLLATEYFQLFAGLGVRHAKLLVQTAKMYILGAVAVAIIFFMTRAKLRIALLRWIILCSAMTADIFLSARFIVDTIL
jgi:hypothetical protein